MALHELRIIFVDGGKSEGAVSGGSSSKASGKTASQKTTLQKVLNYNQTIKDKVFGTGDNAMSPTGQMAISGTISLAKQAGRSYFNYILSDIGRSNGDSNYQAQINRKIEQVTDVTSIIGAGLSGAAMGSVGGPVGAVVGAVIGVASAGISTAFKYAERERTFAHEMFTQKNSQAYNMARANYTAMTGRVR